MKQRTSLKKLRHAAFLRQGGRCFYCGQPMWEADQLAFAKRHGLTSKQTRLLRATGEHLIPFSQGGLSTPENIVAACVHCNISRHKHGCNPTAAAYQERVRIRMEAGKWHKFRSASL